MGIGNDTEEVRESQDVDIFVVGVGKTEGEKMRSWTLEHQGDRSSGDEGAESAAPVILSFSVYKNSLLDPAEAILVCLATILVAAGAQFSTSDLKEQGSLSAAMAPPEEEVMEVDTWAAFGFFAVGSCFLMFLFFFMKYLIYVIIFAFCMGGASCICQFLSICLQHFLPMLKSRVANLPGMGVVLQADMIAMVPALVLPACWLFLRNTPYGWPFQDIIGAGFLCWLQRTLRLPDMKIATLFLVLMFFFDIFWVFISPLIFQQSVMVTVATGGGTGESVPMLLRVPSLTDALGNDRLLGFGDIALPGLLVSYLRRHDLLSKRRLPEGYFLPALIGYFIGLCTTICALVIMHMGQPALLYLVPGTLGTTLCLALGRGELGCLWEGWAAKDRGAWAAKALQEASDTDGP
jgi:signal peptide peptidase-like protein 2B